MVAVKLERLWRGGGHQGESLPADVKLVPDLPDPGQPETMGGPKGQSADVPQPIPEGFLQGNHYMRELVDRLWIAVDAGKAVYDTSYPNGVRNLEARMAFVRAWDRLTEGDE